MFKRVRAKLKGDENSEKTNTETTRPEGRERRRYTRVKFNTAATLTQGKHVSHAMVLDLSLNGVLLETPEEYVVDAKQSAYISIFIDPETDIQMTVTLAHSTSKYLGFECESIDIENMAKLRHLIERNSDATDAPERVFDELIDAHVPPPARH